MKMFRQYGQESRPRRYTNRKRSAVGGERVAGSRSSRRRLVAYNERASAVSMQAAAVHEQEPRRKVKRELILSHALARTAKRVQVSSNVRHRRAGGFMLPINLFTC